ncbi:GH32 C-terminal domain-containing protein [Azotobacter chroococcum]
MGRPATGRRRTPRLPLRHRLAQQLGLRHQAADRRLAWRRRLDRATHRAAIGRWRAAARLAARRRARRARGRRRGAFQGTSDGSLGDDAPQPESDAYRLRVELDAASGANEVRFRVKEGGGHFTTVGYDFVHGVAFVARDADAAADRMPEIYREVRTAPAPARDGTVTLDVIVDAASVEVFVNDGEAVLSNLAFGAPGANGLSVRSLGGDTELRSFRLTPLAIAPIERHYGAGTPRRR